MACPDDVELLALVEGRLAAGERARAEGHLDGCPACLAIVAELARDTVPLRRSGARGRRATAPALEGGEPRYLPGEEIARGGMGRIVAADDRLLGRRVALKLLRAPDPGLARRLLRERQVTARLQHPAIVPVYDAGTLPDGEPFFAMRLVKGESLDRAAAKARSLEAKLALLPAVIGVVDAVAYAHGEGVIHRDLKPQNVLVGPFGEVVVLDWGLARTQGGEGEEEVGKAGAPDETPEATRDGEVLGTLAYMAPEQARGETVDARADVYGLGAILYHVLAGTPPHMGRRVSLSSGAALHAPEPLARRAPDAPADLVAIVERAMAPEPAARYASALELADDLKRWQAGRLVQAHRYGPGELARRFVRRYRAALGVAAAALALLLAFGGVGLWRIVAERRVAEAERARAEEARGRAEAQRVAAEELVEFVLGDLRDRLEQVGRLDALAGVARAVLAYQDRSPPTEGPSAWLRRGKAAALAGDVAFSVGDFAAAEDAHRKGEQAAEAAGGEAAEVLRCRAAIGLGRARTGRGALDEARAAYEACTALAGRDPKPALREPFLQSQLDLAEIFRLRGDLAGARRLLEGALPLAEALAKEAGIGSSATGLLVLLRQSLWITLDMSGQVHEAEGQARAVLALATAQAEALPNDVRARRRLSHAEVATGMAYENVRDFASAKLAYQRALTITRALAAQDPSNALWQHSAGVSASRLGLLSLKQGELTAALAWFREDEAFSTRCTALDPRNIAWQRGLAYTRTSIGTVLAKLRRFDEARASMALAIAQHEAMLGRTPEAAGELGETLGKLGEVEIDANDMRAARAALERSVEYLRPYARAADTPAARRELAEVLMWLARSEGWARARERAQEARDLVDPLREAAKSAPDLAEIVREVDRVWARHAR